ncbi:MAG: hypothetical protein VB108_09875 [Anaerolineaceae bacterium]|nr:hypothetical protein [Anaerolineaceae bacterium]
MPENGMMRYKELFKNLAKQCFFKQNQQPSTGNPAQKIQNRPFEAQEPQKIKICNKNVKGIIHEKTLNPNPIAYKQKRRAC